MWKTNKCVFIPKIAHTCRYYKYWWYMARWWRFWYLFACVSVCQKTVEKQQNQKPENVKTSYRVSEGVSLYSHFCRVALMSSANSCCWQGSSTEMEAIPNVSVVTNLFPFCLSFKLNANWAMFQCCMNRQHASQHRAGKGVKIKVFTKVFQSLPIRAGANQIPVTTECSS